MGRLFGTDGVRGVANKELTPELAFNLGKAGAYVLKSKNDRPRVIIGKDTRVSGDMLENALAAGILAVGGDVIKVGVITTPAVAYLAKHYNADAGVVISASHNTFEYNGIKFFNGEGYKLDDLLEEKIEDIIISRTDVNSHITGDLIGTCDDASETAAEIYIKHLLETVDFRLDGMNIVLDCANGASYEIAPKVYEALGAKVTVIGNNPNGININDGCGSTHPEKLAEKVKEVNADIGLAYDGIAICARILKEQGRLAENKVTVTVMSNIGFHKAMKESDIEVEVTGVGDRYVLESMLETGCVIGGEQSGHIIFREYATTGDGVLSSLQFMDAIKDSTKPLSEMAEEIEIFPQVLVNARINNDYKKTYMKDEDVAAMIKDIEEQMAGNGRVLIRPSGTEPLVRVMLEGDDIDQLNTLARKLADLLEEKFNI